MLRRQKLGPVPEDTEAAARKAFRKKPNVYVEFAKLFIDKFDVSEFSESYSALGQSAIHPIRLLLLLIVAYLEGLSDRQVAEAVAARIDLKYLLALPLDHEGYDYSVLSEMRGRLIKGQLEELVLEKMLQFAEEHGLLKTGKQRTDSTVILSAARRLSRLELVIETLTHALNVLSDVDSKLVLAVASSFEEVRAYEVSMFQYRLPKQKEKQAELAERVGRDGFRLLHAIDESDNSEFLSGIPAVKILRKVWAQQFECNGGQGPRFKKQEELAPASELVGSPHDLEARVTAKRDDVRFGFSTHVTETCTEGAPRLITNVLTTPATTSDSSSLPIIQAKLRARGLKPQEHLVDAGYTKGHQMLQSLDQHGTEVVGPLRGGNCWQVREGKGFDSWQFQIDWDEQVATCPQGKQSKTWRVRENRQCIEISFDANDCRACPVRENCTKAKEAGRKLEIKPKEVQNFIQQVREYERTSEFRKQYAARAGIEGTMSKFQSAEIGRSPYMGMKKTHLRNVIAAGAINAMRLIRYLMGHPLATTRERRFARLRNSVA